MERSFRSVVRSKAPIDPPGSRVAGKKRPVSKRDGANGIGTTAIVACSGFRVESCPPSLRPSPPGVPEGEGEANSLHGEMVPDFSWPSHAKATAAQGTRRAQPKRRLLQIVQFLRKRRSNTRTNQLARN